MGDELPAKAAVTCHARYHDDPIVLVHARALLTSTPEGATAYIDADLRDPDTILQQAGRTLDFTQPVAIMLMGILGHIAEDVRAQSIVKRLVGGVPAGSYLTMNDGTDTSEEVVEAARIWNQSANPTYHLRSPDRIARFFDGLELVEPGVVSPPRWRPEPSPSGLPPRSIRRVVSRASRSALRRTARGQRITLASRSVATSNFTLRHSVYAETSPKQQVAGSSPARGTEPLSSQVKRYRKTRSRGRHPRRCRCTALDDPNNASWLQHRPLLPLASTTASAQPAAIRGHGQT